MRICVLAGGVGSARFLAGLVRVVEPTDVTVVVNTADDERMRGLHVSPDVDTVLYHLAEATDWERGWGLADESFASNDRYAELVSQAGEIGADMQTWFALGDRDLATHLFRTRLLDSGRTLTEATDALRRAMRISATVMPMSNERIATMLRTSDGERIDFQTYFVRRAHTDAIAEVAFDGIDQASAAPGAVEAIGSCDLLIVPPSNPIVSVAPVLSVPGVREAVASTSATRIAISPIIGGKAVKGPTASLLTDLGYESSAVGVAKLYAGLIDVFVLDEVDAQRTDEVEALGLRALVCDTLMTGPEEAARVAKAVIDHAG